MTRRRLVFAGILALAAFLLVAGSAVAATGPAKWELTVTPDADYFLPGPSDLNAAYTIEAENVGGEPTSGQITLKDTLPAGLSGKAVDFRYSPVIGAHLAELGFCPSKLECGFPGPFPFAVAPGQRLIMVIEVAVESNASGSIKDLVKVSGGGAPEAEVSATNEVNAEPPFGFHSFHAPLTESSKTNPYTQAGGHPYQLVTEINFATETETVRQHSGPGESFNTPVRDPKDISAVLPPGLIGNPQGVPHCSLADFFTRECPLSTAVGTVGVRYEGQIQGGLRELAPLYNLQPQGAYPGELGFEGAFPYLFTAGVRSGSDYGINITNAGTPEAAINRVRVTTWGVPADPSHDPLRGKTCLMGLRVAPEFIQSPEQNERECELEEGLSGSGGGPAEVPPTPFLTMPTECSDEPLTIGARYNTWQFPGEYAEAADTSPAVDGCNALSFAPTIEARSTTNLADAPSGLEFNLHVPQNVDPEGVATPELKEAVVKLPAGLSVNPSSANGLGGCTEGQVGLHTEAPAACPDASKLGSAEVQTALLAEPLEGFLYLATPHQNPSGSLLAGYIALEGQGLRIKLPGRFETDPKTGQITAKFLENPQLPFEELKLHLFEGARGALRTPATCGKYETSSTLTPYSAPESGPAATPTTSFETSFGSTGGSCPHSASEQENKPRFHAGTETPQAGIYSPFSLKLVREDGSQELKQIETTLPPGLVGKLAGVAECPQSGIAQAESRSHEGGGAEEQADPSCPAASELGTVEVGAGAGPTPLYVQGHAYLTGPYKGAPLSIAIVTPAVAGPFDLGTVVVKTALDVNPETAQITAKSDEIPHILQGIPLDVRSVEIAMDRPNFTLNPTSCEPLSFTGSALSVFGSSAPLTERFQVGGCPALPFAPRLALSLKGGTKRAQNPALKAVLTLPAGEANVAAAQVTLPHAEFLDNAHIKTICTKPVFAEGTNLGEKCPPQSIYGFARAETPLLEKPLEGPVYLRSPLPGHKLPDLVAALNGQIDVALVGKIDNAKSGGIRNTFELVPDAPVSRFTLEMQGGKKSLLENSGNLCSPKTKTKAIVDLTGQNGKVKDTEPLIKTSCKKKKGKKHHKRGGSRR